ncbi:hypothetical protein CLV51_104220 [Chitinophaga niastensis]|uniref:Uncharacterized protein n=1 Tax=Chitinophaga niastensis TaxID=536980 RepID=A0A2P8HH27_CHINA|nr:hypothetical protein CLV51_104220 [Chitinophaga niastensis]
MIFMILLMSEDYTDLKSAKVFAHQENHKNHINHSSDNY